MGLEAEQIMSERPIWSVLTFGCRNGSCQLSPWCQPHMHHEELLRFEVLPLYRIRQFCDRLWIEVRAVRHWLERITSIEEVVRGEVHHHLPLACLASDRDDFHAVAAAAQSGSL